MNSVLDQQRDTIDFNLDPNILTLSFLVRKFTPLEWIEVNISIKPSRENAAQELPSQKHPCPVHFFGMDPAWNHCNCHFKS